MHIISMTVFDLGSFVSSLHIKRVHDDILVHRGIPCLHLPNTLLNTPIPQTQKYWCLGSFLSQKIRSLFLNFQHRCKLFRQSLSQHYIIMYRMKYSFMLFDKVCLLSLVKQGDILLFFPVFILNILSSHFHKVFLFECSVTYFLVFMGQIYYCTSVNGF